MLDFWLGQRHAVVERMQEAPFRCFVDLWNRDEPRLTHYPQVFSHDFIERRGANGLDRISPMLSSDNDYIREHIYGPAGMQHSDHYSKQEGDSGKAKGYFVPEGQTELIANTDDLGNIGSPAGGGYASANDLLRFAPPSMTVA